MYHGINAVGRQTGIHKDTQLADTQRQQILKRRTDDVEGQPENQQHHADENGNRQILVCQHAVNAHAAQMLAAFLTLDDGFRTELFDVIITHGGNRGIAVKAALILHFHDAVLDHFQLVPVQSQTLDDVLVALNELGRGKAAGYARSLRMILNQVGHGVDAAVHRAFVAEVHTLRLAVLANGLHGGANQLVNALVLGRRDGNDRDAQLLAHCGNVDGAAVAAHLVHHVQRQHHRQLQLQKLER